MNRRQSFRALVGTMLAAALFPKAALSKPAKTSAAPGTPANPKLVPELTKLLQQAKSGELTGYSGVFFTRDGKVNPQSEFARPEDLDRTPAELETLAQDMKAFAAKVKAQGKD